MASLNRRQMFGTAALAAAGLTLSSVKASNGNQTPEMETPSENCLTLETFPVLPGDHPHDVAPAADGVRVWYTAQHGGLLGLLDPPTGSIETIPLGDGSAPHGVIVAPDAAAWVTDGGLNAIVRVDDTTHELAVYPVPFPSANLNTAVIDPQGVVWFTGQSGVVGRVDPARHGPGDAAETVEAPRGRGPYGITATPEGDIFFASLAGSYVGHVVSDGDAFHIEEVEPPTSNQGTRRVWSDSRGIIWTSEWLAGQLGRYDPTENSWQEWLLPGDSPQAYAVYVDERDDVWLSDFGSNTIVRFDPDTEIFFSLPLPDPGSSVRQILGRPGEVWAAASGVDKLVVVKCGIR